MSEELQAVLPIGLSAMTANLPFVALYLWALYMARKNRSAYPERSRFVTIGVALLLAATILGPIQTTASSYAMYLQGAFAQEALMDIARIDFVATLFNYALDFLGMIFVIRAVFLTPHMPFDINFEVQRGS